MAKPTPPANSFPMLFPSEAVSFDPDAFDELIRTQGVEMIHFRAMKCPVGMVDPDDVMRRPHEHHENCSNSFVYTKAGTVTVGFLGNSSQAQFIDAGLLNGSTVQIVLPRFYDDAADRGVKLAKFDRVYLTDESITVEDWGTFAASATGVDKLQFPVLHVHDLMDSHGNQYHEDIDFKIAKGKIVWGSRRPGIDPKTGKGVVCSARYEYRPFWYVKTLVHEVRVAQIEDPYGNRAVQRMPQAAMLQREYFFEKEQNDPQAPNPDQRQQKAPPDGVFGPR